MLAETVEGRLDSADVQAILRELARGPVVLHRGREVCKWCDTFLAFGHRDGCLVERAQQALLAATLVLIDKALETPTCHD